MITLITLIVILGAAAGVIIFFIIKSVVIPHKIASLASLYKQGKHASVVRIAKQMVANDPRNYEAHYYLGLAYQADGKPELALMELKTVNQIGHFGGHCPEMEFRTRIAGLYRNFNQPEEALKEYLLLIKLSPQNAEYYHQAGLLFEDRDRSDKALGFHRKAVELQPNHSGAHFRIGYILYRAKKPQESKAELELALKFDPENYQAFYILGRILKDNHDYVAALVALEKAQRDPEFKIKALVERGSCYMNLNNFDKASGEFERAVKSSEEKGSMEVLFAHYFLGVCYEKKRRIDVAIGHWETVYKSKPNFRDVAEKLSQYQDLRTDDKMKDYLTSSREEFFEICRNLATVMKLSVRDIDDVPNGCEILSVENQSKWRNARKMPKLVWFLRVPEMIDESSVRSLHDKMRKLNIDRGIIVSASNFSRKGVEYAETRPIDLVNKAELQGLLQSIEL